MNYKYQVVQTSSFWKEDLAEDIYTVYITSVRKHRSGEEMATIMLNCRLKVKPHGKKPFAHAPELSFALAFHGASSKNEPVPGSNLVP